MMKMWKVSDGGAIHWVFAKTMPQALREVTKVLEEQLGAGSIDYQEAVTDLIVDELLEKDRFQFTTKSGYIFKFDARTWLDFYHAFRSDEHVPLYFACSEW